MAAYCRVSTEQEEQQNSYQVQIAYYTDLINRKKEWTLAGIFADEGISGTQAKKRPEFLKMIRLCKKQKIDLVITKSISRFARNTVDCLEYVRQLKDLGIGVIFEKENINTLTMTSEFMIAMHGSFAQAESESISKNVSWGKQKAYAEGKVAFQYSKLLGYKKGADGKPEIVPDEAETVRLIFELFLDGYSLTSIKNALEIKDLPTATGRKIWNQSLIQSILKNEKYVGDALLQKTFTSDCITKKVVKNNGERPMYLVTNHHAPIIDRDTFNRVQQELARRSSKRKISDKTTTEQGKYSGKYALSELLICGHCGTPYRRQMWKSNGNRYADLDKARNGLILLISEGGCDEDTLDAEFAKIHAEEQSVNEKLSELRKNAEISADTQSKIDSAMEALEHEKFELDVFDNIIIRKLIECIKILSKTELLIIFKGGIGVKAEMEE